ncbi:UDP-N-acetylmuramoyl-tripeptide--D-alanyl-D-alanine ligase [Acetivibrio saccincola]|jgi:UDP-N-acetylmuramoyl-tripeptide--D-alanyl-D-alanine ligase|uniref:UDP-N-acetylmuramoyl-tripeptide--D-alanyl-D-alanine ligase n=1 Tax=Acetivibrio saccincola TaxID=1677857 RepID=A0A2S8RDN1_9FIRM|nr:UDP-N-acetylmuramoyl-tripeptide--D-alanyl-D-alanine ligase [Acetivibrio saccincola]NLW28196.1 UDP-N-acetylmuramoyl-tripeptide--D-alanyl-D-alanine ligase [Acetivibrio saccincola]PQQ67906.1 UDP-N-acetylmuramoyl-tripeptide--D-alanyl-D-alanine ligase [Acetivibrio saccincola]
MQQLKCAEILNATEGKLLSGRDDSTFSGISTDSRNIKEGDLFIPLKGERFDGHDYVEEALAKGAFGALTEKDIEPDGEKVIIKVDDTLKALRLIAAFYRSKFNIPFIGITGSVGKTSTKEMVWSVLSKKFNVLKNQGNFNNEIGVPLTIFRLEPFHEAAVVEMGMNNLGEISRLTSMVKPDIAIITNIGVSHIENLGSKKNILRAKMEILEGLNNKGLVILNGDDNLLFGLKGLLNFRTVFYGFEEGLDYQAYNVRSLGEKGSVFEIEINKKEYEVKVPVPGIHNIYNALASIAAGVELMIPEEDIIKGIEEFSPAKMRLDIINSNGIKVINDAYNASPQSMEAALVVLKEVSSGQRSIAVLGDMYELGEMTEEAHIHIGKFAAEQGIDYIIAVGDNAKSICKGALSMGVDKERVLKFENNKETSKFLGSFIKEGDVILVKGSRGMKMEEIVNKLTS